jgi:hypothetical protein
MVFCQLFFAAPCGGDEMNAPKHPTDLAPSTFDWKRRNGHFPWHKQFAEPTKDLLHARIPSETKLTYFWLQPILNRSEKEGYLVEDGKPMTIRALSRIIGKTEAKLAKEIDELIEYRFLKKEGDEIYEPWMVLDKKTTDLRESEKQPYLNEYSSNSDKHSEVVDGEGITQNQLSSFNDFNHTTAEKSRADSEKSLLSAKAKALAFAGKTASAPSGAAVPPSASAGGITDAEIAKLKRNPKYAGKDVDEVIRKCREHYADSGEPITLKMVRGWLKRQRTISTGTDRTATPKKSSKVNYDYIYELINKYASEIIKMPPEEQDDDCDNWMRNNVPGDYDLVAMRDELIEHCNLLCCFVPDQFESCEDENGAPIDGATLLAGKKWIGGEDAIGNNRLKGSKWLASKSAASKTAEPDPIPATPAPTPARATHKSPKHRFTAARQPADGSDEDEEEAA